MAITPGDNGAVTGILGGVAALQGVDQNTWQQILANKENDQDVSIEEVAEPKKKTKEEEYQQRMEDNGFIEDGTYDYKGYFDRYGTTKVDPMLTLETEFKTQAVFGAGSAIGGEAIKPLYEKTPQEQEMEMEKKKKEKQESLSAAREAHKNPLDLGGYVPTGNIIQRTVGRELAKAYQANTVLGLRVSDIFSKAIPEEAPLLLGVEGMAPEGSDNPEFIFNTQKAISETGQTEIGTQIDEIQNDPENMSLTSDVVSYITKVNDLNVEGNNLKEQFDTAVVNNDQEKQQEIIEEAKKIEVEDLKNKFTLVENQYITGNTKEEVYDNIRTVRGDLSDKQIDTLLSKKFDEKITKYGDYQNELQTLGLKYYTKLDTNMVTSQITSFDAVVSHFGGVLTDDQKGVLQGVLFSDTPEKLDEAKKNGTESEFRQGMGIVADLVSKVMSTNNGIELGGEYIDTAIDHVITILSSPEFKATQNKILELSQDKSLRDANGNLDVKKFSSALVDSDEWKTYTIMYGEKTKELNISNKYKQGAEQGGIGGVLTTWGANTQEVFDRVKRNYIYEDVVYKNKDQAGIDLTKKMNLAAKYIGYEKYVLPFLIEEKKKDITYAQNPINRFSDTIRTLAAIPMSDPAGTVAFVASFALPGSITKIGKLGETAEAIKTINNPVVRSLASVAVKVVPGTIENGIMMNVFDSLTKEKSDPLYYGINFIPDLISSIALIRAGNKTQVIGNSLKIIAKDAGIDITKVTSKDLTTLNYEFTKGGFGSIFGLGENEAKIIKIEEGLVKQGLIKGTPEYTAALDAAKINAKNTLADFVVNGKLDIKAVALATEKNAAKYVATTDMLEVVQRQYLTDRVKNGELSQDGIDVLYNTFQRNYGDAFAASVIKNTKKGVIDKIGVVADGLLSEQNTIGKLANMGLMKAQNFVNDSAGVFKNIDARYNEINDVIVGAMKTATAGEREVLAKTQVALKERRGNVSMFPYYAVSGQGAEKAPLLNKQYQDIITSLDKYIKDSSLKTVTIENAINLPKEILDNMHDPQKLSQLIFGDEKKYQKLGVKTYDLNNYVKKNRAFIEQTIGRESADRLDYVLKTINDVNGGRVKIYELPSNIKNIIGNIGGFTTYVKDGNEASLIIGMMGGMVDITADAAKLSRNSEYIDVLCHELGHNIMLSLKDGIRENIFKYSERVFDTKIVTAGDMKNMLPNASKERLSYLVNLSQKNKQVFIEEVSADMISQGIQKQIFGVDNAVEDVGAKMYEMITQDKLTTIAKNNTVYDVVASKFIKAIKGVFTTLGTKGGQENLKTVLYYIGDRVAQGQREWTDIGKAVKELKAIGFLESKVGKGIEGSKIFKSQEQLNKRFDGFGVEGKDYIKTYSYGDGQIYRGEVELLKSQPEEIVAQSSLFYAYKTDGEKIVTLKQGITNFDIAKVYSESLVRDMVYNADVSAKDLGQVISLSFDNPASYRNITEGAGPKEVKKINDAIEFARQKHNLSINQVQKFWDPKTGKINLTDKIDGYTFAETLTNVGSKVTRQGVYEGPGQDLIKFLNYSDKESYNKILVDYMNTTIKDYANNPKLVADVSEKLDLLGAKGVTFGEKYADFTNKVEQIIYDAARQGEMSEAYAAELSKDVVSRLFVGGPGYLSVINKTDIGKSVLATDFMKELAYGLVEKNAKYTESGILSSGYSRILDNLGDVDRDVASMYAEVFSKDVSLEKGMIEWQSYSKQFYNFLSAKTENYILNSLKGGELTMNVNSWSTFINKISHKGSMYGDLIDAKLNKLGVLGDISKGEFSNAGSTEELLGLYKKEIEKNQGIITAKIGDKKFETLNKEIDNLLEKGISEKDSQMILDKYKHDFQQYSEGLSVDNYFHDLLNVEETQKAWLDNSELITNGMFGGRKKEELETLRTLMSPEGQKAVDAVQGLFQEYGQLVGEIKSEGFAGALNKIVEDNYLGTFFDVKGKGYNIEKIKKVLGRFGYGDNKVYRNDYIIKYSDELNSGKGNFLTHFIGSFVNPVTVAEQDRELGTAIQGALGKMNESKFVFKDSALDRYLVSQGVTNKYVGTKTYLNMFTADLDAYVAKGLTYDQLTKDIHGGYIMKYFKEGSKTYKFAGDQKYMDLVDSYVEILGSRKKDFGLFEYVSEGKVSKGNLKVMKDDLGELFDTIGKSNSWKALGSWRGKSKEADKILGLKGNWLGLSSNDLAKFSKKAEIYNKAMFDNFLYKSFAQTDTTFNFWDKVIRGFNVGGVRLGIKPMEEAAAKAQYLLFYSVFGPGLSAAGQQMFSNYIHLLGRTASEIGLSHIDNMGELMGLVEDLYKFDVFAGRPELVQLIERGGKFNKAGQVVDSALSYNNALAISDKLLEANVKQYSLLSAFTEKGYTKQGAEEIINRFGKISEEYKLKGYDKYQDFNRLVRKGGDNMLDRLSYKIGKDVELGNITREQGNAIVKDFSNIIDETRPMKGIVENAKVKAQTFYQISDTPELVQNRIGGVAGSSNMRFMNRASRKAGEYAFKFSEALIKGDMAALGKITKQVVGEGLQATKMYLMFDTLSGDEGVSVDRFASSLFLPYTLLSMLTFKALPLIGDLVSAPFVKGQQPDETDIAYEARLQKMGGTVVSRLKNDLVNTTNLAQGRIGTSIVFWAGQFNRIRNGLSELSDAASIDDVYSTQVTVPFLRDIAEVFANVIQGRVSKYDTMTIGGINRDYVNTNTTDTMMNFLVNQKVTKGVLDQDKLINSYYNLLPGSTTANGDLSITLLPFSRDQKFSLRAYDKFAKDNGLGQLLYGGVGVGDILTRLEQNIDGAKMEELYAAQGLDYDVIQQQQEKNDFDDFSALYVDEDIPLFEADKIAIKNLPGCKVYNFVMGRVDMQGAAEQKGLFELGKGITEGDMTTYSDKVIAVQQKVEDSIMEMQKTNPNLIKAGAYDKIKRTKDIENGLNQFGEQVRIGIIMKAMVSTNKALFVQSLKQKYGKDWRTKNSKTPEVMQMIAENDAEYKMKIITDNYQVLNMGNRTIGKDLTLLYINSSKDNPMQKQINQNVGIGTTLVPSIIQKTVEAQGVNSLGINNVYSTLNIGLWNKLGGLDDDEKPEYLKRLLGFKLGMVDNTEKFGDQIMAQNVNIGIVASDVTHLDELRKNPDLMEAIKDPLKWYLDRVTVSEPLTDEKIVEDIQAEIFKEPGTGGKKRRKINFDKLNFALNKFSDFNTDFNRYVMKQEPLQHIQYKVQGATILPIRKSAIEARPPKAEYDFVKIKEPTVVKTPDIVVETIKTTKSTYTGKAIKGQNVYIVKTSKGTKKK